jgi:hypothetical protein
MYKEFQTFKPFQKFQSLKRYALFDSLAFILPRVAGEERGRGWNCLNDWNDWN